MLSMPLYSSLYLFYRTVKKHEEAATLYVETIDLGEAQPRQVVSGLVNFIPIEQMQGADVVVLCNLKPANLRGVRSEAMVLAASNPDHTHVELIKPPAGSKVGERIFFADFPGTPDEQLNPKHKIWETIQPVSRGKLNIRVPFFLFWYFINTGLFCRICTPMESALQRTKDLISKLRLECVELQLLPMER
jgi:tRNA-binding EMAP/Myf-like protein